MNDSPKNPEPSDDLPDGALRREGDRHHRWTKDLAAVARPWETLPYANAVEAFELWGPDARGVAEAWEWLLLANAPVITKLPPTKEDGVLDYDWRKKLVWLVRNLPETERRAFAAWLMLKPFWTPCLDWAAAARPTWDAWFRELVEMVEALEGSARCTGWFRRPSRLLRERRR